MSQVLETDDLQLNEVTELALVTIGSGVAKLRVVGGTGSGGSGTVTSVAGAAPIVITGSPTTTPTVTITAASDVVAGSMSAADKAKLDNYGAAPALLVFAPAATPGGNVFASFSALKTVADALAANDTPVTVFFQGALCTIPTGAWNFSNPDVVFTSSPKETTTLAFASGATLSGVSRFEYFADVTYATGPVMSFTSGTTAVFLAGLVLTPTPGAEFFSTTGAGTIFNLILLEGTSIGDGTNPVLTTGAGASTNVQGFAGASIDDNYGAGAGTNTIFVFDENVFTGTNPVTLLTNAVFLLYNDILVSPALGATQVQAAIDKLKSGGVPTTWDETGAGASVVVAAQRAAQFFSISTDVLGAATSLFTFPAHGTAVDGQEVTIVLEGATVLTPVDLAPGANNVMGDPKQAGQYGASGATLTASGAGQVIRRKYKDEGASGKWRPFG